MKLECSPFSFSPLFEGDDISDDHKSLPRSHLSKVLQKRRRQKLNQFFKYSLPVGALRVYSQQSFSEVERNPFSISLSAQGYGCIYQSWCNDKAPLDCSLQRGYCNA
ncbi:hypothetical protein AB6A40_011701 [Gnathostoma spinigerum]|uniref:Uncharacterized protein n=1 Tax=Gnathostoma spinigerum TaxID=75299 RepID=A0ABD6F4D6_9BILA